MDKEKKKKFRIGLNMALFIVIVVLVVLTVMRLNKWNHSSTEVDLSDIEDGQYDMECLDFYVYPPEDYSDGHVDDGVLDILVIGDYLMNNYGEEHSILNILKENIDANFYDITAEKEKMTTDYGSNGSGINAFSLYYLVTALVEQDFTNQLLCYPTEPFQTEERYDACIETLTSVDLNDIDMVIIMYSLHDYFASAPELFQDEDHPFGYHGALHSSIKMLQENYPHLQIVLSSPTPEYLVTDDGIQLGSNTSFGYGYETVYTTHQYAVATELCISYIDNYYYKINESNITEYSDGLNLNDKGIDLIGEHMVHFLETKGN